MNQQMDRYRLDRNRWAHGSTAEEVAYSIDAVGNRQRESVLRAAFMLYWGCTKEQYEKMPNSENGGLKRMELSGKTPPVMKND